jgi:signal transduction histidine kinase
MPSANNNHNSIGPDLPENFSEVFLSAELELLGKQMRAGLPIGIALYLCFAALDWLVAPESFSYFLLLRLGAIVFPLAMIPLSKSEFGKKRIRGLVLITFLIGAASMVAMCYELDGFTSNYFVGLILMMFFVGLFLPWSLLNNIVFLGLLNGSYFAVCFYKSGDFVKAEMPIAFMLGSAALTHLASSIMQNSRRQSFAMQLQLDIQHDAEIASQLKTISMLEEIDERDSRLVAVGQIASTLAHDMRGPLTAIINRAELLRIITDDSKQNEMVDSEVNAIEQSVRRVNSMIQELLEFVSGREVVLEQSVTIIEDLLKPVAVESEMALQHSGIAWSFLMQGGENKLLVDRHRFARIIENIINNARDALLISKTPEPKVSLNASTDDEHLILRIGDNGPGVPKGIASSLFQPYTTAGKAQGHGLGLAIVRNLVTANGGSIELDSTTENGCAFVIKLPLL